MNNQVQLRVKRNPALEFESWMFKLQFEFCNLLHSASVLVSSFHISRIIERYVSGAQKLRAVMQISLLVCSLC